MKKRNYCNKSKKIILYMSCMLSFMVLANNGNITASCKETQKIQVNKNKEKNKTNKIKNKNKTNKIKIKNKKNDETEDTLENIVNSLKNVPITMPLFQNTENSVLAKGTVTYKLNDDETVDVELKDIDNPGNLYVYLVPIIEDQIQPRIILQKEGNSYKGKAKFPNTVGRLSLHFYFVNPQAPENGPDMRFRIGAADICNIQNAELQLIKSDDNPELQDVFYYDKEGQQLEDRPPVRVFQLYDYIFVLLEVEPGTKFYSNMMAVALGDGPNPTDGSNDVTVSNFSVSQGTKNYSGLLIYKNTIYNLTQYVTVHFYKDMLTDPNFDSYLRLDLCKRKFT